jgi:hypothetical protein
MLGSTCSYKKLLFDQMKLSYNIFHAHLLSWLFNKTSNSNPKHQNQTLLDSASSSADVITSTVHGCFFLSSSVAAVIMSSVYGCLFYSFLKKNWIRNLDKLIQAKLVGQRNVDLECLAETCHLWVFFQ